MVLLGLASSLTCVDTVTRGDREDYEGRVTGEKCILLADGVTEFGMAYGSEHPILSPSSG